MSRKQRLPRVAVFENGEIRDVSFGESGSDVVLALPLSRLILRVLHVPKGEDFFDFATPVLTALSPFPDEPLTVSCEVVRETERGAVVIAAALPESATDDLAEALDARKFNVTRVDSLALGQIRQCWSKIAASDGKRRLVKIKSPGSVALIVLDGDQPLSIRSVSDEAEMSRETMLSLLEAEDFGGPRELGDTVEIEADDEALAGVAVRSLDPGALNALPDSWAAVLDETRFKAKLAVRLVLAGALWVLVMGVLFGVPVGYGYLTDHQMKLSRSHAAQYAEVKAMKAKVDLVRKYSDHTRGALETLRIVSDCMPDDVLTLTDWSYDREKSILVKGESCQSGTQGKESIMDFLENLRAHKGPDQELTFKQVNNSRGLSTIKGGRQRFEFELSYQAAEAEE